MSYRSVVAKIIMAREDFLKTKGNPPGYIDLPIEMETDLCTATFDDIGITVTNLALYGPRTTFKNLFGMSVAFDAKDFKVYGDENQVPIAEVKLDL